jgi:hypothetical protein
MPLRISDRRDDVRRDLIHVTLLTFGLTFLQSAIVYTTFDYKYLCGFTHHAEARHTAQRCGEAQNLAVVEM